MPRMEIIMRIDEIWQNIISHEGETFYTAKGLPFTYVVINDHEIVPYRGKETRWALSKNLLNKALDFKVFSGKEFNNSIIGSSYVRSLLEDRRIILKA